MSDTKNHSVLQGEWREVPAIPEQPGCTTIPMFIAKLPYSINDPEELNGFTVFVEKDPNGEPATEPFTIIDLRLPAHAPPWLTGEQCEFGLAKRR